MLFREVVELAALVALWGVLRLCGVVLCLAVVFGVLWFFFVVLGPSCVVPVAFFCGN